MFPEHDAKPATERRCIIYFRIDILRNLRRGVAPSTKRSNPRLRTMFIADILRDNTPTAVDDGDEVIAKGDTESILFELVV